MVSDGQKMWTNIQNGGTDGLTNDAKTISGDNNHLMQVKSIAERSKESIL